MVQTGATPHSLPHRPPTGPPTGAPRTRARTRLALRAHDDAILGILQVGHADRHTTVAGRLERGHVDQVGEVGAAEAGGALGDGLMMLGGAGGEGVGGQRGVG